MRITVKELKALIKESVQEIMKYEPEETHDYPYEKEKGYNVIDRNMALRRYLESKSKAIKDNDLRKSMNKYLISIQHDDEALRNFYNSGVLDHIEKAYEVTEDPRVPADTNFPKITRKQK